jgi:hypothetical protein
MALAQPVQQQLLLLLNMQLILLLVLSITPLPRTTPPKNCLHRPSRCRVRQKRTASMLLLVSELLFLLSRHCYCCSHQILELIVNMGLIRIIHLFST